MLTYRPVIPGSDEHLTLLERTRSRNYRLGQILYPDLMHRRACAQMASAAARVKTSKSPSGVAIPRGSVPITSEVRASGDGCSTKCAR